MNSSQRNSGPSRRQLLAAAVAAPLAPQVNIRPAHDRLGLSHWSYRARFRATASHGGLAPFRDVVDLLEHTARLGGGGAQVLVKNWDDTLARRVRETVERHGLYLEGQINLPWRPADEARFNQDLRAFKSAGGAIARTVLLDGRRYEIFKDAAAFAAWQAESWAALVRGEAIARRVGVKLALENHKDLRVPEFLALLERMSSPFVGMCVDTGNSLALLEDMQEVVEALAPYAFTTHLKDIAVKSAADGFLMSEVPLGEGMFDLIRFRDTLRRHNPLITFNLEMITRDPLPIPCLTPEYFATMPELPARDLGRTLALVHDRGSALPTVSDLPEAAQLAREEENIRRSFVNARERLSL